MICCTLLKIVEKKHTSFHLVELCSETTIFHFFFKFSSAPVCNFAGVPQQKSDKLHMSFITYCNLRFVEDFISTF